MKQIETEFEMRLDGVMKDARAAAGFIYTELTLNHQAGLDGSLHTAINRHAGFWRVVASSLQSSGLISLGRIYDDSTKTFTVHRLIDYAEKNPGIFSHQAFIKRKSDAGIALATATNMVQGVKPFSPADLKTWREQYFEMKKIWDDELQLIRHKVFAHAHRVSPEDINEMFAKTNVERLESITVYPLGLTHVLWQLYINATPIGTVATHTKIKDILENLPGKASTPMEHVYAAINASEFLKSIK